MRSAKLLLAGLILRVIRWYFVGRAATRVQEDDLGIRSYTPGKIIGGRVVLADVELMWVADEGSIDGVVRVSAGDMRAENGSWKFTS